MLTFADVNRAYYNWYDNITTVLKVNYCFWPMINYLNFTFIPIKFRILAINCCALFWNAYLAHVNQKSVDKVE